MPITFLCSCGQSMTVRDEFAGKMGRCPRCKNAVQVPMASTAMPAPMPGAPPMPGQPMPGARGPGTPQAMPRPGMPTPVGGVAQMPLPGRPAPATAPGVAPIPPPRPGAPGAARPPTARPGPGGKPAGKAAAKLLVVNGPQGYAGKAFQLTLTKVWVVGRDPGADVPIPSERISRRHCQLEPTEDGVFVLVDLGSSNGTLVNQERINGRKVLLGGEYIQVGDVLLRFAE